MKLLLIVFSLAGLIAFYNFSPIKPILKPIRKPIWFGPPGKKPPNLPVRWGYYNKR